MCPVTYCLAAAQRSCLCGPAHGSCPCGPASNRPLRPIGTDVRIYHVSLIDLNLAKSCILANYAYRTGMCASAQALEVCNAGSLGARTGTSGWAVRFAEFESIQIRHCGPNKKSDNAVVFDFPFWPPVLEVSARCSVLTYMSLTLSLASLLPCQLAGQLIPWCLSVCVINVSRYIIKLPFHSGILIADVSPGERELDLSLICE